MACDKPALGLGAATAKTRSVVGITTADISAPTSSLEGFDRNSDTEGAAREKPEGTNLAILPEDNSPKKVTNDVGICSIEGSEEERNRVHRKRSVEEVDSKCSVEITTPNQPRSSGATATMEQDFATSSIFDKGTPPAIISPKGKRDREEFEDEISHVEDCDETKTKSPDGQPSRDKPKAKRYRGSNSPEPNGQEMQSEGRALELKKPHTSDFANTSATSPFANLAAQKCRTFARLQPQTSDTALKASQFDPPETSSGSSFGAPCVPSYHALSSPKATDAATKGATVKNFSNTRPLKSSPLPIAATSGFGALGSAFGHSFGGGGKLTGYGGGSGPKITAMVDKAMGAPKNESGDEGTGNGMGENNLEKKDLRFFEQDVETGEENEETVFSCRAKLFKFDKDGEGWKRRGYGNLKVNVLKRPENTETHRKARFIMRTDGSHNVILNSPIWRELGVDIDMNRLRSDGTVLFMGHCCGNHELLLLKFTPQCLAGKLLDKIADIQRNM